jgi:hypothetical protein
MEVLQEGQGKLVGWHDPDENREYVLHNKSRALKDKTTTAKDVVTLYCEWRLWSRQGLDEHRL